MNDELNGAGAPEQEGSPDGAVRAELEGKLVEKDRELSLAAEREAELEKRVSELDRKLEESASRISQAVASYRALAVKANPVILEELITGDSIEAIEASLERARSLLSRVRQQVEAEAARTRVPGGAPARMPPDLSALSPRGKIQYGIGGKK